MGVAKASLEASVRYMAAAMGPEKGIRVNAVSNSLKVCSIPLSLATSHSITILELQTTAHLSTRFLSFSF
jgi:enoyl-[acyl-carrier-protein] reductase (NADH)